jgi:hypothetical protein
MPGNEKETINFILQNKNKIKLKYVGKIKTLKIPYKENIIIATPQNIKKFKSDNSRKKADIYINDIGISLKQEGGSFAFNRIQRKFLPNFLNKILNFENSEEIIKKIDFQIQIFHEKNDDEISSFSPLEVMGHEQFNVLLKYLMLEGSPKEKSKFPAKYILNSKKRISLPEDLKIFSFEDYLDEFSLSHVLRMRRSWYGQESDSEHKRAKGLLKAADNKPWCFDNVSGLPKVHDKTNKRWRDDIPEEERKTCYYLMIEKK